MKKFLYLAVIVALPATAYAGVNYVFDRLDAPYVIDSTDRERTVSQRYYNYSLVWNEEIGKLEVRDRIQHRPIAPAESMPFFEQEPVQQYYRSEWSI